VQTSVIVVTKRGVGDYIAHFAGDTRVWEAGRSEAEAIGKLVISTGASLGIAVVHGHPGTTR
jgi:hypothetical protein